MQDTSFSLRPGERFLLMSQPTSTCRLAVRCFPIAELPGKMTDGSLPVVVAGAMRASEDAPWHRANMSMAARSFFARRAQELQMDGWIYVEILLDVGGDDDGFTLAVPGETDAGC